MKNLETELQTRKTKIDVQLKEQGWDFENHLQVVEEVDTKQSDFNARNYLTDNQTYGKSGEHAYADYLLLDRNGDPLAIIEVKKTSRDPIAGQKQVEDYADDKLCTLTAFCTLTSILNKPDF